MTNLTRVNTTLIDPGFLSDLVGLLDAYTATMNVQAFLTCGWRDQATEQAGYDAWKADPARNPKFTKPEDSAHVGANFPDGRARAADITFVVNGKDDWNYNGPVWQGFIAAVRAHPRLHSGADFTDAAGNLTPDEDHVQKLHWQRDKIAA